MIEYRYPVRHGQCLALVMGYIDECDTKLLVDMLDLDLHVLA